MKLTPYKTLLTMAKDAIDKTLAPVRANSCKKKAELEMAKLDERVATLETTINTACTERDINFDRLIDLLDEVALAERKKAQFQKILEELFP